MNSFKYLVVILLVVFYSCSSEGDNQVLRWKGNDLSDYALYYGSPQGGKPQQLGNDTDNQAKKDSVLDASLRRIFGDQLRPQLYYSMTVEFNDDYLTYVDSMNIRKIVSIYDYKGDSLFVNKSDGSMVFVAIGNSREELYRMRSLVRYPLQNVKEPKDTIVVHEGGLLNLEAVLDIAGYESMDELINVQDTIVWCNVKYLFQK